MKFTVTYVERGTGTEKRKIVESADAGEAMNIVSRYGSPTRAAPHRRGDKEGSTASFLARASKKRAQKFSVGTRVYAAFRLWLPNGGRVSEGERGTVVEAAGRGSTKMKVQWDDHPNEPGWYDGDSLES